jgi:hypothetical protein
VAVEHGLDAAFRQRDALKGGFGPGLGVRQKATGKLCPVSHLLFLSVCRSRFGVEAGGVEPRGVALLNVPEAPASPPPWK